MDILYRTRATATGGRDGGRSVSDDGVLDVGLALPKELGGPGGARTNPEQLFAAGYAACFLSAIKLVAGQEAVTLPPETTVTAAVGIGRAEGGFALDAAIEAHIPGVDKAVAQELIAKAHQVCPYSRAMRNNVDVLLTVA
jgi:Ohr subfamily peroxiredoxin